MEKKGFTLIELLAVIVVLALIALVATPIILNIIEKTKKSAFKDSVYGLVEAVKLKYAENMLDEKDTEQIYLIEEELKELQYTGMVDGKGILKISKDGKIELAIYNEKWCVRKSKEETELEIGKYEGSCVIPEIEEDPVVIINGDLNVVLRQGEKYIEEGVIAKTVAGKLLSYETVIMFNDEVVQSVDTSLVGTYKIIYYVSNNGKTASLTRVLTINSNIADKTGANEPNLENGLVPIKWTGKEWIKADSSNHSGDYQWYDYDEQMWANGASVVEEYRSVEIGTVIPENAILAYFVWIPRYEYDYTNLGMQYAGGSQEEPGEIKVNFIKGISSKESSSNYKVHPAFTFGEEELTGIWVSKFETTGEALAPTIKPNMLPLMNQNVSTQFATAQRFGNNEGMYGINIDADAHMMKNSEWGAIAYLSQSKYGKYGNSDYIGVNKEVYVNNFYNNSTITGCSSGDPSSFSSTICLYTYEQEGVGTGASTTGTIYGVYDMSGGLWDRVMGIYQGSDTSTIWGASGSQNYAGFSTSLESKYYDLYTSKTMEEACEGTICYGHALSETNRWYSDYSTFANATYLWITRGGYDGGNVSSGIFGFGAHQGSSANLTFRVTLK